jgi:hypothetical protein
LHGGNDEIWPQLRITGSVQAENENENETNHWRTRKAMGVDKTGMRVKHESIKKEKS